MSDFVIAFFVAIAGGTWLYNRLMRHTGNNTKNSLVAAGASAVLLFILMIIILEILKNYIKQK